MVVGEAEQEVGAPTAPATPPEIKNTAEKANKTLKINENFLKIIIYYHNVIYFQKQEKGAGL